MKHIKTYKALSAWMELLLFQVSLSLLCLVHMCPQLNKKKTQDICFVYYEGSLVDSISLSSVLNPLSAFQLYGDISQPTKFRDSNLKEGNFKKVNRNQYKSPET